jgi:hypothetical protein
MKNPNKYAIGIIVQSTDTISKWRTIATTLKTNIIRKAVTEYDYISNGPWVPATPVPKLVDRYYLINNQEKEISFFIGIASNVSATIKTNVGVFANFDNAYFLPSISFVYFGSVMSLNEMKQKLFIIMDDCWEGYMIIDSSSNLTNLSTKFIT